MEDQPTERSESGDVEPTDSCSETSPSHPGDDDVPSGTANDPYQDVSYFCSILRSNKPRIFPVGGACKEQSLSFWSYTRHVEGGGQCSNH